MNLHIPKARIILRPVLNSSTQKQEKVFYVHQNAKKRDIKEALLQLFGDIKIQSINTTILPGKKKYFRGKIGLTKPRKKAYVRLAPGYNINFAD